MATYSLNDEKMFMDIADKIAIVINSETGIYYGLNGFGTTVLENLAKGADSDELLNRLQKLPNAPENLAQRFNDFVADLLEKELLIAAPANMQEINIDAEMANSDNFVMEINSYTDAQEMLLADPIHEVKEETGWTPEKESIGYTKEETKEREKKVEQ